MKKFIYKCFHYLEPIWSGDDGKPSLKRVLAIAFSFHALYVINYAVRKWDGSKSLADLAMLIGIELGFTGALIGITQWGAFLNRKLDAKGGVE